VPGGIACTVLSTLQGRNNQPSYAPTSSFTSTNCPQQHCWYCRFGISFVSHTKMLFPPVALLFLPQVLAVPWARIDKAECIPTQQQQSFHYRVFPQLTWLRDTAIEKIWGKPGKCGTAPITRSSNVQLPATLLAKYGGDVVLRFNLSTPYEERSLAEAADTLFLDIWEFRNNWADIRLREDDVCASPNMQIAQC